MEPWTASCAGCPGHLPSPTADSRGGCLHSGPRPSGRCLTEVDLPSLSLQVDWCGVHSICDGDFRKSLFPSFTLWGRLFPRGLAIRTFQLTLQSAPSSFFTELLLPYGGGMPPFGFIVSQSSPLNTRFCLIRSFLFSVLFLLLYN